MEENQIPVSPESNLGVGNEAQVYAVPWSIADTWLGVVLLVLLSVGMLGAISFGINRQAFESYGVVLLQLVYVLPVALIFAWRGIHWRHLGFGGFTLNVIGMGCGLLIGGYIIILLHNLLLSALGVDTQGDQVFEMFKQLKAPFWFILTGAIVAPLVEEIFFRGFLLQGFRQKYGWKIGILLSSCIFAAAHLDPASFIPTFILGCVLAFMYHRSNSLWPSILFHAAINSFSLLTVYMISRFPSLFPT